MQSNPTAVQLDLGANELRVTWADDDASVFSGARLRFLCPCAQCRGHYPGQVPEPDWEAVKDVRLSHVEAVGNYALRLDFDDGHNTGIFSFDFLRRSARELPDQ